MPSMRDEEPFRYVYQLQYDRQGLPPIRTLNFPVGDAATAIEQSLASGELQAALEGKVAALRLFRHPVLAFRIPELVEV